LINVTDEQGLTVIVLSFTAAVQIADADETGRPAVP
jgi:hypothetical protein